MTKNAIAKKNNQLGKHFDFRTGLKAYRKTL